jgi:hypothetical protein
MYPSTAAESSDKLEEIYNSTVLSVKSLTLTPSSPSSASPLSRLPSRPDTVIDIATPDFRPALLSSTQARDWTSKIVSNMFPGGSANRWDTAREFKLKQHINPFVATDGSILPSASDVRYPLPLPSPRDLATELVYIFQTPPVRGKFDAAMADKLGVPKGKARGLLVKGEEIQVEDASAPGGKRVVRSEHCMSPTVQGSVGCVSTYSQNPRERDALINIGPRHRFLLDREPSFSPVFHGSHAIPDRSTAGGRRQAYSRAPDCSPRASCRMAG